MEQCDCVFDFNFLTIFHSMSGICADVFFFLFFFLPVLYIVGI